MLFCRACLAARLIDSLNLEVGSFSGNEMKYKQIRSHWRAKDLNSLNWNSKKNIDFTFPLFFTHCIQFDCLI